MTKRILLSFFTIILTWSVTLGQEFDVREFVADPSDLAAIRYPRKSVNDEPAALIKILTNIQGMQFDSNQGIIDIEHKEDGYWLYVAPRERRIRLMAAGYLPLDVSMPEPAVGNRVYTMTVASIGLTANIDLIPVNFIVDGHNDATLIIGDQSYPIAQTIQLARGSYQIRIEKPGYRTLARDIEVSETNTLFRYQLEGIDEQIFTIRTTPPGATVYINNIRQRSATPYQDFLFPGTYSLRLALSEYNDIETSIIIRENQTNEFVYEMQKFVGTLVLRVNPSDARITINQRNYAGQREIQFAPGTYRILVEKEGFYPIDERFVIEEGKILQRSYDLVAMTGSLRFVSQNPDAQYRLLNSQGQVTERWRGSNILRNLPVGNYRYEGELQGYANLRGTIIISENTEARVEAIFSDELRLEFIREQDRIAAENRKQEEIRLAQLRQAELEKERQAELARQKRQENARAVFRQLHYGVFYVNYNKMHLNTGNFQRNIESDYGLGIGMQGIWGIWSLNQNVHFNYMTLTPRAQDLFDAKDVYTLTYSINTGPSIKFSVFEFFALGGYETSIVTSDAFEYESVYANDFILEYGVMLMPRKWKVGFRYSTTMPLNILSGYPPFTRQEFGLGFKF